MEEVLLKSVIERIDRVERKISNGLSETVARLEVGQNDVRRNIDTIISKLESLFNARTEELQNRYDTLSVRTYQAIFFGIGGLGGFATMLWQIFRVLKG